MTMILTIGMYGLVLAQQNVNGIIVKCPPCRPVAGCDQCFETQAAADAACSSSARVNSGLEKELTSLSISIYPNPSRNGIFTVEGAFTMTGNFKLFSPVGSLVKEFNVSEASSLQVGQKLGLTTGIYILLYTDKSGKTITKRIMVDYKD